MRKTNILISEVLECKFNFFRLVQLAANFPQNGTWRAKERVLPTLSMGNLMITNAEIS